MALETVILGIADFVSEGISIVRNVRGPGVPARIVWANTQFEALTGWSLEDVRGISPLRIHGQFLDQDELSRIRANIFHSRAWRSQMRCVRKDGSEFWGDVSITPVPDQDEAGVEYFVHVYRDISDQKARERRTDAALKENEELFAALDVANQRLVSAMNVIPDPFAVFDTKHRLRFFNHAYAAAYSRDPEKVAEGMSIGTLIEMASRDGLLPLHGENGQPFRDFVAPGEAASDADAIYEMPDGRYFRILRKLAPTGDIVVARIDITDLKRQAERLKSYSVELEVAKAEIELQSLTDSLTGIGNRRYLDGALAELLAQRGRLGGEVMLFQIDLDRFKQINDTLGHQAGDHVLQIVAERLRSAAGGDAVIARIGGDEFVIAVHVSDRRSDPAPLARAILEDFSQPVTCKGVECRIGASVGVAATPLGGTTADALMANSDIALYRAKMGGRARWQLFTRELRTEMQATKRLADELHAGIERGEFVPYFQLQFDADRLAVCGAEILMRWNHPREGVLTPDRFLGVAEDMLLVEEIDRQLFKVALDECRALAAQGYELPRLSFNVTARRIAEQQVLEDVELAAEYPTEVVFELLETAFVEEESDQFRFHVDALREKGVGFEIDDFGSGRASILALTSVQPQMLKIDRRLIAPLCLSPHAEWLVKAVIDIADALDIGVVAEGVETVEQAQLLCAMGCDVLQGFLFSRPEPSHKLPEQMTQAAQDERLRLLGLRSRPTFEGLG